MDLANSASPVLSGKLEPILIAYLIRTNFPASGLSRERNSLLMPKNSLLNSLGNLRKRPAELKGFCREDMAQHP